MSQLIVTYNAPAKEYIAYRDDNLSDQAIIPDSAVDARAADHQRVAFEHAERNRSMAEGAGFVAREFTPTIETNQHTREQYAQELAAIALPEQLEEAAPAPKKGKKSEE